MRYREIMAETEDEGELTAVPYDHIDPLSRKPMVSFRIFRDGEEVRTIYGHHVSTAEEAIQKYHSMEAWERRQAETPVTPKAPARRIRSPRPDIRVWIVPAKVRKMIEDGDDEPDAYLYHVTSWPRARQIIQQGLLVDRAPMFSNYQFNTGSRVFLTERDGVRFWAWKIEQHLQHNFDRPPPVAVLRVHRADVEHLLRPDAVGTKDARASCYYIETDFK